MRRGTEQHRDAGEIPPLSMMSALAMVSPERTRPAAPGKSKPLIAKISLWNKAFFLVAVLSAVLIRANSAAPRLLAPGALAAGAFAVTTLAFPADAEARRFGGGRSFGFRGSRGFSRGFGKRSSFGRRSGFGGRSGYRRGFGGFGFPFLMGMGLGGFGGFGFGLLRMLFIPLILFFVLRMMSARR